MMMTPTVAATAAPLMLLRRLVNVAAATTGRRAVPGVQLHLQKRAMAVTVGIDLGTTQSCVSFLEGGIPTVIPDKDGHKTTPSIVAYLPDRRVLVGQAAKNQLGVNPTNTLVAIKRLIGRNVGDPETSVVATQSHARIVEGDHGEAWVALAGETQSTDEPPRSISPVEVSADILKHMKHIAEDYLGDKVEKAVITVPAYFNDNQRQATRNAGALAGLDVMRVVNEPTAAAIAYGYREVQGAGETLAVYDLGGGTFDISILKLHDGFFEVLATNGDTFLGGEDVDAALADVFVKEFARKHNIPTDSLSEQQLLRVKEAAEKAKMDLDNKEEVVVAIPMLANNKSLELTLTRDRFNDIIKPVIKKTISPCRQCVKDAGLKLSDIDSVLVVGGMTRIPLVQALVEKIFKRTPLTTVNPLEAVAKGAALQAGILTGEIKDMVLIDVTPLSLGIETLGGLFSVMIPRNTSIPCSKKEVFSTGVDNQSGISIRVFQGERAVADANQELGSFTLDELTPGRAGQTRIAVVFDIDANGIVTVSAVDEQSGRKEKIEVKPLGSMSQARVEELLHEAKERELADKEVLKKLEVVAKLDIALNDIKAKLGQFRAKLDSTEVDRILHNVDTLHAMLKSEGANLEALEEETKAVMTDAMKLIVSTINPKEKSKLK